MTISSFNSCSNYSDPLYDSREDHFIPESEIEEEIRELKKQKNLIQFNQISELEDSESNSKFSNSMLTKTLILSNDALFKMINGYGISDDPGYDSSTDHFIPASEIFAASLRQKKLERELAERNFKQSGGLAASEHLISEREIEEVIYNNSEHFFSDSEIQEVIEQKKVVQVEEKFDLARGGVFEVTKRKIRPTKDQDLEKVTEEVESFKTYNGRSPQFKPVTFRKGPPANDIFSMIEKQEKAIEERQLRADNNDKGRTPRKKFKLFKFSIFRNRKHKKSL